MGSTIPVKGLIRDITRYVKEEEADSGYTYDRLQLELLAQYDPSESHLDGLTFEEQISMLANRFDMDEDDFENLVRLDTDNVAANASSADADAADADGPVTT